MKFVIDLDTLAILEAASSGKRGDSAPFEVVFQRGGVVEQLPSGVEVIFAAKLDGQYDGAALIYCDEFTRSSTGTDARYLGNPSLNGSALNALFLTDGNPANDVKYLDLMAEFTWSVPPADPISSDTFQFRVKNDVWKGTEDTPMGLPDPFFYLRAPAISVILYGSPNTAQAILSGVDIPARVDGLRLFACGVDMWSADGTADLNQPRYERAGGSTYFSLYASAAWENDGSWPALPAADTLPPSFGGAEGTLTISFLPYPAAYPGQILRDGTDFYKWNATTSQWDSILL